MRTVLAEIIVTYDEATETLSFVPHRAGGTHTTFTMPKPRSGVGQPTALEDLELIRRMGARYGDDEIARVLNKLGRRTGKGKRWNQERVHTARRNHDIAAHTRARPRTTRSPRSWSGSTLACRHCSAAGDAYPRSQARAIP